MISKIFGKKSKEDPSTNELKNRIEAMNLSEMNLYVKGRLKGLEVSEEGLIYVMQRLLSKVNDERYYLDASDDPSKLKKGFDLVINIAKNKKVTIKAMELIATFISQYKELIYTYDREHKDIYEERLKKALEYAQEIISAKVAIENRMIALE